jgi:hypothetical protein
MAARGRSPGFVMSEEHRRKISNSNILSYLIAAAEGNREMSATQANVALGLLKKVMPDLSSTSIEGTEEDGSIGLTVTWQSPTDK